MTMPAQEQGQVALVKQPEVPALPVLEVEKPVPPALPSLNMPRAARPPAPEAPVLQAAKPPPPPAEFARRLAEAGAKTGDVQISLLWNNYNDLDLHCVFVGQDGQREHIWFSQRRSASGGELDVDRNAGRRETNRPVENIYWRKGRAPFGRYQVYVHYWANHGDPDPTPFEVNILANGERRAFKGEAIFRAGDTPANKRPDESIEWIRRTGIRIHEFEVAPRLWVAVPQQLILYPGASNRLPIQIGRVGLLGPVECFLEGDLYGIQVSNTTIPDGQSEGYLEIRATKEVSAGKRTLNLRAKCGAVTATSSLELVVVIPKNLALAASPELEVFRGESNELPIRLACSGISERVRVRLDGNLQGIRTTRFDLDAKQESASLRVETTAEAIMGSRELKVVCEADGLQASAVFRLHIREPVRLLRIAVPKELQLLRGGEPNTLPVRVARRGFEGEVRLELHGDTTGLITSSSAVTGGQNIANLTLAAAPDAKLGQRTLQIIARGPNDETDEQTVDVEILPSGSPPASWSWQTVLMVGFWTTLLALGLSAALVAGQNWYLGRPLLLLRQLNLLLVGSLVAGLVSGGLGQVLYGILFEAGLLPKLGFLAGWSLLGCLLGRFLAAFIPNLHAWRASIAGAVGGLAGSVTFLVVSFTGEAAGRFMGALCLGFAIGLTVALIEVAYRKYWLELRYSPYSSRVVNLGPTPVILGGDPKRATVHVPGAPAKALQFWEKDGQVYCLDIVNEQTFPVSPGYRRRLRDCEIVVHATAADGTNP